jgi:predicted HTH transcriptional regulator
MTSKLPINLTDLLRQRTVEGERIEYKAGWNPESVLHTLCAFANDFHNLGGGYIIIGVEEQNGRPVLPPKGIDPNSLDAIQKEILNLGHHALPVHERAVQEHAQQVTQQVTQQVGTKLGLSRDQVTGEARRQPGIVERELLRRELQDALGRKHEAHFREAYLNQTAAMERQLPR